MNFSLLDGSEAKMNFALQNMWNFFRRLSSSSMEITKKRVSSLLSLFSFFDSLVFPIVCCCTQFITSDCDCLSFSGQLSFFSINSNIIRHEWTLYKVINKKKEGKNSRKHVELIGYWNIADFQCYAIQNRSKSKIQTVQYIKSRIWK